jgi:AcrR family transcriptional regulator
MPRKSAARTRQQILESAYESFYRKGFTRSSVDEIAVMAKVTKRTLYYHFKSKDELLAAVLEMQHELSLSRIRKHEERYLGSPEKFATVLFAEFRKWSEGPAWTGSGITRLVMELADLPGHPARAVARRHKAEFQNWAIGMLQRAGAKEAKRRARELHLLIEGVNAMILISGDRTYADTAAAAAKRLLKQTGGSATAPEFHSV